MPVFHAGRERTLILGQPLGYRRRNIHARANAAKRVVRDGTGAQQKQIGLTTLILHDLDDGGFQADLAAATVNDDVHLAVQILYDVRSIGR